MFGVVLWSDPSQARAVIWCEDHGDLAFFNGNNDSAFDGVSLDAGDLIQFDVSEGRSMRHASNPRLVAEAEYPTLAQSLKSAGKSTGATPASPKPAKSAKPASARIVPFAAHSASHARQDMKTAAGVG